MNDTLVAKAASQFSSNRLFMRNYPTLSATESNAPPWINTTQNLLQPRRETESTRQLSCDVVFGSPSANCMGTGVCRISARAGGSPLPPARRQNCRSTVGLLFPIEGGNGLSLVLTRALLCSQLYKNHLRQDTLRLEHSYQLPTEISETLGLHISELLAGEYPIQKAGDFLRIDFLK